MNVNYKMMGVVLCGAMLLASVMARMACCITTALL